ncbi:MAG TPA: type IV toxin-antitoxin system AbiEi family antitoxin domain-containing protein [Jatrophihabitantaceae bacterium]
MGRLYDQAESQGGYFTTREAADAGVSTRLLTHYVAAGDIERIAHGVYRLTRFPAHRFGDAIAATLWVGEGSAVSHDSALAVYGLGPAMPVVVHVTVSRPFRGSRAGVVVHRAPLGPDEMTVWDDVPVVSALRALTDVAAGIDPALAAEASRDAIQRGLITPTTITTYLNERPDAEHLAAILLPTDDETIAR